MVHKLIVGSSLFAIAVLSAGIARAAPVLDQSNIVAPPALANGGFSFTGPGFTFHRYQTLTVGITGTLTEVDIQYNPIYPSPTLTGMFNVYGADPSGVPNTTLLGTGTLGTVAGGWASFFTNIGITAGQVIAVEPFASNSGAGWSFTPGGSTYAGGEGFNQLGSTAAVPEGVDYGFRTFVDTATSVPEPATWAMMVMGLATVGFAMRRRSRQARTGFVSARSV